MTKVIEFLSILFLGILLVLSFTHAINGTFLDWINSKFFTKGGTWIDDPKGKAS